MSSDSAQTVLDNVKSAMILLKAAFKTIDASPDLATLPVEDGMFNSDNCEGRFWENPPRPCQHCKSCTKYEGAKFQGTQRRVCHSCKLQFNRDKKDDPALAERARGGSTKRKKEGKEKKKKVKKAKK